MLTYQPLDYCLNFQPPAPGQLHPEHCPEATALESGYTRKNPNGSHTFIGVFDEQNLDAHDYLSFAMAILLKPHDRNSNLNRTSLCSTALTPSRVIASEIPQ